MGDDKLPKIPSFEELGISEDEIEELEREIAEESAARREGGGEAGAAEGRPAGAPPAVGDRPAGARDAGAGAAAAKGPKGPRADAAARGKAKQAATGAPEDRASKRPKRESRRAKRAEKRASRKRAAADAAAAATHPPTTTPPPWGGLRGPATLLLLLVTAWLSSSYRTVPSPVAATAPDSVFSSARAMSHLARIASEARPPGSPNHARTRDYLIDRLGALGHTASVQTATSFDAEYGGAMTVATVRNILARIPGTEPGGPAVLVTAHYDSREIALGAADDGSGVVAILETVRALGARAPLRNDVIVLITDAEEIGLLGARAFVDEH
ncbi:MAG: M28 family peptidase, partial [Gemmatimonadetes bacterium]|nr:M28 family peptidase [Gemmatimonadota bacterium]